jgi:hypothetical protein
MRILAAWLIAGMFVFGIAYVIIASIVEAIF